MAFYAYTYEGKCLYFHVFDVKSVSSVPLPRSGFFVEIDFLGMIFNHNPLSRFQKTAFGRRRHMIGRKRGR